MGIMMDAASQATRATRSYGREMGGIARQAGRAEAELIGKNVAAAADKAATVAYDTLAVGAYLTKEAYGSTKGAVLAGADRAARAAERSAQFTRNAAIAGKMELRAAGQDIAFAAGAAKDFVVADARQTAADVVAAYGTAKGAVIAGADMTVRAARRGAQKAANVALDVAALGALGAEYAGLAAKSAYGSAKGAVIAGSDMTIRAAQRGAQFTKNAALAGKMQLRATGEDLAVAAQSAYGSAKGAVIAGKDMTVRAAQRTGQYLNDAALAGKALVDTGIDRANMQAAIAVHEVKQAGRRVGEGFEHARLTVRGDIAKGRGILGDSVISLGGAIKG